MLFDIARPQVLVFRTDVFGDGLYLLALFFLLCVLALVLVFGDVRPVVVRLGLSADSLSGRRLLSRGALD